METLPALCPTMVVVAVNVRLSKGKSDNTWPWVHSIALPTYIVRPMDPLWGRMPNGPEF